MRILKYPIDLTNHEGTEQMVGTAEISGSVLSAGYDPQGRFCLWALEEDPTTAEVTVVGTGWKFPRPAGKFMGTFLNNGLIWHCFVLEIRHDEAFSALAAEICVRASKINCSASDHRDGLKRIIEELDLALEYTNGKANQGIPVIERCLTLSARHMPSRHPAEFKPPLKILSYNNGFLLFTPFGNASEWLRPVITLASKERCRFICFDVNASTVDGLEVFEWEPTP